jgi:hypothetical protein
LANIDHQVYDENLTFTFLQSLPPFPPSGGFTSSTYINELSMELICGQLMQKDCGLNEKCLKMLVEKLEILTTKGDFRKFKRGYRLKEIQKQKAKEERIEMVII